MCPEFLYGILICMRLSIKVTPGAKKNTLTKVGDVTKVHLTAPPVDGKANEALVRFLAEHFKVRLSQITICKGLKSRQKIVEIVSVLFLLLAFNGLVLPQVSVAASSNDMEVIVVDDPIPSVETIMTEEEPQKIDVVFSNIQTQQTIAYRVQEGDSLGKIARRFHTTIELLMKSNHLTGHAIAIGQKLRGWTVPFEIYVDKYENLLAVKADGEMIKTYRISTGANNITPVGDFIIKTRYKNPTWFNKGKVIPGNSPQNALGTRWLGFDKPQYGIHGTIYPELIGQQVSHGCVRMRNSDVEELYDYIPTGTRVMIAD